MAVSIFSENSEYNLFTKWIDFTVRVFVQQYFGILNIV